MPKRNWPDHIAVGRVISIKRGDASEQVKVVDVKCGPLLATIDPQATDIPLAGTLKLCLKPLAGGAEFWTPPTDGKALVEWCEKQDSEPSHD
jgi:hypothetical protein